jgi:hypothetical protein
MGQVNIAAGIKATYLGDADADIVITRGVRGLVAIIHSNLQLGLIASPVFSRGRDDRMGNVDSLSQGARDLKAVHAHAA